MWTIFLPVACLRLYFFIIDIRFCTSLNTTRARRLCDIEIFLTSTTFQTKARHPIIDKSKCEHNRCFFQFVSRIYRLPTQNISEYSKYPSGAFEWNRVKWFIKKLHNFGVTGIIECALEVCGLRFLYYNGSVGPPCVWCVIIVVERCTIYCVKKNLKARIKYFIWIN